MRNCWLPSLDLSSGDTSLGMQAYDALSHESLQSVGPLNQPGLVTAVALVSDQLLSSKDEILFPPHVGLLKSVQQQQLLRNDAPAEEQDTDTQIQQLLQLKRILQLQSQQAVPYSGLSYVPHLAATSGASVAPSPDSATPPLVALATSTDAMSAQPVSAQAMDSMMAFLAGLLMGDCEWDMPISNALALTARHSADLAGIMRSASPCPTNHRLSLPDTRVQCTAPSTTVSPLAAIAAILAAPTAVSPVGGMLPGSDVYLQSSLYSTTASQTPAVAAAAVTSLAGPAVLQPPMTGRYSLDCGNTTSGMLLQGVAGPPAAVAASPTGWLPADKCRGPAIATAAPRRASWDMVLSCTSEAPCPPYPSSSSSLADSKSSYCSINNGYSSTSARSSPVYPVRTYDCAPAAAGAYGDASMHGCVTDRDVRQPVVHQAPIWADIH